MPYIDEYIVDIKDMNPEIYHSYTGGDLSLFKNNLIFLVDKIGSEKIVVRVPLIPEFNTEKDRDKSVEELKNLGITRFDVFDYVRKGVGD